VSVVDAREAITQAHHEEWARVVASLTRRFGDLDIAEEAAAEAFATAVGRWPADGVPPNPGAWLTTTANRKAIDRIRRENKLDDKQKEAQMLSGDDPPEPPGAIEDERLRLIFTCCHPALAIQSRVALTLRMVGGLTMPEIARAFLVQEATVGQRITRAKAKIKAARIPYRVPSAEDLPARVSGVLAVLFLVFNEGYLATGPGTDPVRHDLTAEAIRLTRLIRALMPEDGEVAGLLALMLLTEARRTARVSARGELVTLDEQDRGAWDAALIAEGHRLVRERLAAGVAPGSGNRRQIDAGAALSGCRVAMFPCAASLQEGWPLVFRGKPVEESGGTHQGKGGATSRTQQYGDLGGGAGPAESDSEGLVGVLQLRNPGSGLRGG
jgi:RNA polymerase sigma-70 factor (ECF subfamily)